MILAIASIGDIRKNEIFLWEILACALLSVAAGVMALYGGDLQLGEAMLSLMPGAAMILLSIITREGIGYGDGLIVLAAGPGLGLNDLVLALMTAMVLNGFFCGILLVLKRAKRKTRVAFVPFLAIGTLLATTVSYGFGGWL